MPPVPEEITRLLKRWKHGEGGALDDLIAVVYPELKRIARRALRGERANHTLQTSALINEAYLRLVDQSALDWQDRGHFFAVATRVMRHILIDHARARDYAKRGGSITHLPLDDGAFAVQERAKELIALDEALERLAIVDERKSQVVELRFFGGLTVEETAEVMGLSPITIKREWRVAKAWLHSELGNEGTTEK